MKRYPGGDAELLAKRTAVAEQLVAERLLRPEDLHAAASGAVGEFHEAMQRLAS